MSFRRSGYPAPALLAALAVLAGGSVSPPTPEVVPPVVQPPPVQPPPVQPPPPKCPPNAKPTALVMKAVRDRYGELTQCFERHK